MILYIHGLNSSSGSAKAIRLRADLAPIEVLSTTYPAHRPTEAVAQLSRLLDTLDLANLLVVSSSMGGFYGQYLAGRYPFAHLALINPALTPWELIPHHLGPQYNPTTGEHYELTEELSDETRRYACPPPNHQVPTTLFVDRGDELIDWRIAQRLYEGYGDFRLFEGGSHAFDHMEEAIRRIREICEGLRVKG